MTLQRHGNATRTTISVPDQASASPRRSIATRNQPHTATAGTRHSYVSHLIEDGVDPLFVQQQVGHSWASTTATYTTVGSDAKNRMLRAALARVFDGEDRPQ
jgi:site-specific recombinase XerD